MDILLIMKNTRRTSFMRAADLFEPTKFVGHVVKAEIEDRGHSMAELLDKLHAIDPEVVGVIGREQRAILPGHKVISNGDRWTLLDNIHFKEQ